MKCSVKDNQKNKKLSRKALDSARQGEQGARSTSSSLRGRVGNKFKTILLLNDQHPKTERLQRIPLVVLHLFAKL
ncbi:MAG: hypothetical protein ACTIJQ_14780, partial [Alcaligenes sp.]